jgi:hypothetical protein
MFLGWKTLLLLLALMLLPGLQVELKHPLGSPASTRCLVRRGPFAGPGTGGDTTLNSEDEPALLLLLLRVCRWFSQEDDDSSKEVEVVVAG